MAEQIPARTDSTIERILAPLIDVFPGGATAERVRIYADLLWPMDFTEDDLREGVQRTIHVWNRTTFPPFAELRSKCADARALRLGAERSESHRREEARTVRKLPPEVIEAELAEIRKFRLKVMPVPAPNIRTDREYRRKKLGIVPLTQKMIDHLNRSRREMERNRQHNEPTRLAEEIPF